MNYKPTNTLPLSTRASKQYKVDFAKYDLDKKIPDMRYRGFLIETSYGEIDIDPEEGQQIADLVERILHKRLKQTAN